MAEDPVGVLVAGAAGQIGCALMPMIAQGLMLHATVQPVILHMLDIPPAAEALTIVKMDLVDAASPLLKANVVEACSVEKKERKSKNVSVYKSQASALKKYTAANCKLLVVANPANTNALISKEFAPSILRNIACVTRLDHNKALGQISERLNIQVSDVENVIIWGNHSSTHYSDVSHATIITPSGKKACL